MAVGREVGGRCLLKTWNRERNMNASFSLHMVRHVMFACRNLTYSQLFQWVYFMLQ